MTNVQIQMTNEDERLASIGGLLLRETSGSYGYDLADRTARFGESIISFALQVQVNPVTRSLVDQLVRAGTSVGSNYEEADGADTRKDFFYKIGLCKREAKETRYWLRMINAAAPSMTELSAPLLQEAWELARIFAAIRRSGAE